MIKSTLLTVCFILGCLSQTTLAQNNCQTIATYNKATNAVLRQGFYQSICFRLKFETGSLNVANTLGQCYNAQINVYDSNNRKLADMCSTSTFTTSGSAYYIDITFGQGFSYLGLTFKFNPSSSSNNNGGSNNGGSNNGGSNNGGSNNGGSNNGGSSSNTGTCGLPAVQPTISRIVGGTAAKAHSWPWQVYLSIKKNNNYYMCGGSLIDNSTVLTAAHCIYGIKAADVTVYAGIHYRSEMSRQNGNVASKIVQHESYSPSTLVNDIALIKLQSSVAFGTNISPVCLPSTDLTATSGIVTGWGGVDMTASETADELMQVKIPVYPTSNKCGTEPVSSMQFCAGTYSKSETEIKDSCFGDSGGPVVTRASSTSPFVIDGVVSYGETNVCNGNGIYTRVFKYVDWINKNRN